MINVNNSNKKSILVYVIFSKLEDIDWNMKEFLSLATSSGIEVVDILMSRSKIINPKYFIGIGKLLELKDIVKNRSVSVVLLNCTLSANQERNLSKFLQCKIMDRNQLIINIFAQRARSYEGKLQAKLAQLRYLNSRLTHEWNHLERQIGGIKVRGGPGETQLESDRRLINQSIFQILLDLKKIENQRKQKKHRRIKNSMLVVSLVGYTNAGKSTLFNLMTTSKVDVDKKLFVTLDPTCRRIKNNNFLNTVLIDTVGFIQNLPEDLIISFKSTLQEAAHATLLLHVVDVSSKKNNLHIDTVNCILKKVNMNNIPVLLVMNKIDQIDKIDPHIDRNIHGKPTRVWISARNRLGISLLYQSVIELLSDKMVCYKLKIPINSNLYQHLYKLGAIRQFCLENEDTIRLKVRLSTEHWHRLSKHYTSLSDYVIGS